MDNNNDRTIIIEPVALGTSSRRVVICVNYVCIKSFERFKSLVTLGKTYFVFKETSISIAYSTSLKQPSHVEYSSWKYITLTSLFWCYIEDVFRIIANINIRVLF